MNTIRNHRNQILTAAGTAAVLDAAFAFVAYVLIDGRYNFETLLQYIASGLIGDRAFTTGTAGIATAALGFAIHGILSLAFTLIYYITIRPHIRRRAAAIAAGTLFGTAIWMFNTAIVLPLVGAAHEPFLGRYYVAFLIDHALFVGLPIALIAAHRQTDATT